jgi:hypothetical protein
MLQAIQNLHMLSVLHPSLYFGTLMLLAVIVCPGWYKLGRLQAAAVASPAPVMAPARRRVVFYKKSQAFVLSIANLVILGSLESSGDTIAATVALRVT